MNAKLIVAVIAAVIAAPSYAGQQFGRDSVYATAGSAPTSQPYVATAEHRFGRDSVYATQGPIINREPVKTVAVEYKFGRDSVYATQTVKHESMKTAATENKPSPN